MMSLQTRTACRKTWMAIATGATIAIIPNECAQNDVRQAEFPYGHTDCVRVLNSPEVGLSMSDCVRLCRDNPLALLQTV